MAKGEYSLALETGANNSVSHPVGLCLGRGGALNYMYYEQCGSAPPGWSGMYGASFNKAVGPGAPLRKFG